MGGRGTLPALAAMRLTFAIFAGGCAGTLARAGIAEALVADPGAWPWATLVANVLGSLMLGWVAARLPAEGATAVLLGPGLCAALTTFSTFQLEVLDLLDESQAGRAGGYVVTSLALGLAAVAAGTALGRRGRRRA